MVRGYFYYFISDRLQHSHKNISPYNEGQQINKYTWNK